MVVERDVRSSAKDPDERRDEEAGYLASVQAGEHTMALALGSLRPTGRLVTRVIRDRKPFMVTTLAELGTIDRAFQTLIDEIGLVGHARLARNGKHYSFELWLDPTVEADDDTDSPAVALLGEEAQSYRVTLTAGRFVSARGFDLLDERVAVLRAPASAEPEAPWVYSLTWSPVD